MKRFQLFAVMSAGLLLMYCTSPVDRAAQTITEASLAEHIKVLADDAMMGRAPATEGEQMAVDYIIEQYKKIGLEPGMPDGGWVQKFPILAQRTDRNTSLRVRGGNSNLDFAFWEDLIVSPAQDQERVSIRNAELVYVGYGIIAPEEGWDDYKGQDMTGKILVMKNSDPATHPDKFDGESRTYYGRWTYKYEVAEEVRALGVLIIHTDVTAGYPWSVVTNSFGAERFKIKPEGDRPPTQMVGWLSHAASRALFRAAGLDLDEKLEAAESPDFTPVSLGQRASINLSASYRELYAQNVVGKLRGNDPVYRDEYLVFSAHHDHLGVGEPVDGDSIYNGAIDNASGVSSMINMARAYKSIEDRLKRSMLFVAVGAEESGLLGSKYFAANPTVHPGFMTANINLDGIGIFGRTHDFVSIGLGRTSIDAIMIEEAARDNRTIAPDPNPELGLYYRSDHFSFAQVGVPSTFTREGTNYVGRPDDFHDKVVQPALAGIYHTVHDRFTDDWDLSGGVEDMRLMFRVGYRIANHPEMMSWTPGNEFEAARIRALEERATMD